MKLTYQRVLCGDFQRRDESTPKKLSKTVNKKWKYNKGYLSLSFIDVKIVPYDILCNKTFGISIMVPVKLWHHSEFKGKEMEYFINQKNDF